LEKERPYRALACEVISYSQTAQAALVSLLHSAMLKMLCIHHINSNSEAWPCRRRHNAHQPYHRYAINAHGNTGGQGDFSLISKDDLSLYYRIIIHKREPLSRLFSLRRSRDVFLWWVYSVLLSGPTQPSSSSFDILFRL